MVNLKEIIINSIDDLRKPPSSYNHSLFPIIQLLIMVFIAFLSGKELYAIYFYATISLHDLILIIVDFLLFVGTILVLSEFLDLDYLKDGLLLFYYGLYGSMFVFLLDLVKTGYYGYYIFLIFLYFDFSFLIRRQLNY